jgi:transcriptional regulator with XRE-family HTH domain
MGEVGQEIRRLREAKGLSQTKLAALADMAVSGVSQIENGHRNPNSATLIKLARALEVEVSDLFPKGQAPLPLEQERIMDRPEVQEWLRGEGHMSEEEFFSWAREHESLEEIEDAIVDLHTKRGELIAALRSSAARKALFPTPPGLSGAERKSWLLKPPGRWELQWEVRHEYLAREVALVNYSRELFVGNRTPDYLVYGPPGEHDDERHQQMLEARRVLEESYANYAKAVAV